MNKGLSARSRLFGLLRDFLEENYYFRREERYKGFWGRVRAWFEIAHEEAEERRFSGERYWKPDFRSSDPRSYQLFYKQFMERHEEDNFSLNVTRLIRQKGLDHVEVYKKARIDRRLFSKIRSNRDYIPAKRTIFALAIGMELDLEETTMLLRDAGFYVSDKILFDVIMKFFITNGIYDMDEINAALVKYGLAPFL